MSTHKHFDGICCVVLVLTLVLTAILANGESLGIQKASTVMGYEKTLFDPSKVHTIDIRMDDWDTFLDNCTSEEYYDCTVVIDNEAYKNVAIRGKGNISLTQVQAYGNDRYSFKIEFDHYEKSNTYYGLDKLCLNNLIQDNTCMKDYLTYQMMGKMGVASPLCSYVYITVNGEDWGLYLAVEGVEESFLRRNYGKDYGELYKPDSMSMGGGRGNGGGFDMNEFFGKSDSETADETDQTAEGLDKAKKDFPQEFSQMPEGMSGEIPEGILEEMPDDMPEEMSGEMPEGMPGEMPEGMPGEMPKEIPGEMPEGMPGEMPEGMPGEMPEGMPGQMPKDMPGEMPEGMPGEMPGGMPGSSEDVLLKYIDEEYDSYSNIFDNAKTDITDADKTRLIEALKNLGDGENLDSTVDTEAVIKYFVVHNFVLNFDSYTGAMIHNYYLYEKDGQMQMIPWDYNLAFGGFQSSGSATSLVNDPIDSPVSGGSVEDRPMIAWIFENQDYTEQYHQYFSEFVEEYFDSGYFEEWIESVISLISPYVEKDPTKFCTYEEFQTGSATLKEFCLLRAESVSGQLEGTIGSTDDTQESDTLIDAGDMQISDMGAMDHSRKMPHGNSAKP